MKKLLLASAFFGAFVAHATAADRLVKAPAREAPPVFSWTGSYFGGNVGYAWGKIDTASPITNFNCGQCYIPSVIADINNQQFRSFSPTAITGGVQVGANYQFNSWVFGGEADINSFHLTGASTVSAAFTGFPIPAGGVAPTYTDSVSTSWLVTLRTKTGFAADHWLLYVTSGLAVTDFSYAHSFVEGIFGGSSGGREASNASFQVGYVIGGGVEYAWTGNWSVKAEYLHLNFGSISSSAPVVFPAGPGGSLFMSTASLTANIARVGLNYRFGGR